MRVYLPATARDLSDGVPRVPGDVAYGVTPVLRAALPDEDDEGLELSALLAAADASVELVAQRGDVPRRVVVAADVSDVQPIAGDHPAAVSVAPVPWTDVVSIHVDEPEAQGDIAAAAAGDGDALERAADADLLWFDVVERSAVAADLLPGGR